MAYNKFSLCDKNMCIIIIYKPMYHVPNKCNDPYDKKIQGSITHGLPDTTLSFWIKAFNY